MQSGGRWHAGGDLREAVVRVGLLGLWVGGAVLTIVSVTYYLTGHALVGDGHAYWSTGQPSFTPYTHAPNTSDAFLYSPAFAQLVWPLALLPWPVFAILWVGLETAAFAWLLRPLGWRWALPLILWCSPELVIGNVLGFLAIALVLSTTRPASWAAMLLTKPTFGVGALWHVARGEWRRFGVAAATTLAVAAVSFAFAPHMWVAWVEFLLSHRGDSTLFFPGRLVAAVVLTVLAARRGQVWLLAFALLLATPVFAGSPSLTILAAVPRLLLHQRSATPAATRADTPADAEPAERNISAPRP